MKRTFILISFLVFGFASIGQQWLNLNLNHVWNDEAFSYGTVYTDQNGNAVEITRVQYYLSHVVLTHDGGQETILNDVYILGSGNVNFYSIDYYDVTALESIRFDLGVDGDHNHLDPNTYATDHPLAPQNPNMHWGWTAGYKFLAIEGNVDSDGDNIPDAMFQFHVVGEDNYLKNITNIQTSGQSSGAVLNVDLKVDVANWLKDVDLINAGTNHGVYQVNEDIMNNTLDEVVFEEYASLANDEVLVYENNIFFDYSQPYAPTIYYKFPKANKANLEILDMQGRILHSELGLPNEGNYFIEMELNAGAYVAVFKLDDKEIMVEKFMVRQ